MNGNIIIRLIKTTNSTLTCLAVLKMEMHFRVQMILILIVNVDRKAIIVALMLPKLQRRQCIDLNPSVEIGRNHFGEKDFLLYFLCAKRNRDFSW